MSEDSFSNWPVIEEALGEDLKGVFKPVKDLGQGGMGRVIKVVADPESSNYTSFLADIVACKKSKSAKELAEERQARESARIELENALQKEIEIFDTRAGARDVIAIRNRIKTNKKKFEKAQSILIERQSQYIETGKHSWGKKYSSTELTGFLSKMGIDVPEYNYEYALKIATQQDRECLKRLRQEWNSLISINHPNLIRYLCGGDKCAIMEFIPGIIKPADIIERFTIRDKLEAIIAAGDGLAEAHRHGVIHRDLKPDNIAFCEDGTVKVVDFGLAKAIDNELSRSGVFFGTPYYAPPEQWEGSKLCDERSDIYSLGAALYYYIAEQPPFYTPRAQPAQIGYKVLSEDIAFPDRVADSIDGDLQEIIFTLMAKDPDQRPQSMDEVCGLLENYVNAYEDSPSFGMTSLVGSKGAKLPRRLKVRSRGRQKAKKGLTQGQKIGIGAVAVVGIFILALILILGVMKRTPQPDSSSTSEIQSSEIDRIKGLYEYAEEYSGKHSYEFQQNIERFNKVVFEGRGTKYEMMANDRVKEIIKELKKNQEEILSDLEKQANTLIAKDEYDKAIELYTAYAGICEKETKEEREKEAEKLKYKKRSALNFKKLEKKRKEAELKTAKNKEEIAKTITSTETPIKAGKWINLIQGDSKEEAGWKCADSHKKAGRDNFQVEDGKLAVVGNYIQSRIYKDVLLGDCEFEFTYNYKAIKQEEGFWNLVIINTVANEHYYILLKFREKLQGNHHVRFLIKGTNIKVLVDSKEPVLSTETLNIEFRKEIGDKIVTLSKLRKAFKGKGKILISTHDSPHLSISNLRYRLLDEKPIKINDKSGWTNLVQGNSKEEAGWYCPSHWGKEVDVFRIDKGSIIKTNEGRGAILKDLTVISDCEFEFDYDSRGLWYYYKISYSRSNENGTKDNYELGFTFDVKGKHHVRIRIQGFSIRLWMDGEEIEEELLYRNNVKIYKNEKYDKAFRMEVSLSGKAILQINSPGKNLVTISNLRYRLLGGGRVQTTEDRRQKSEDRSQQEVKYSEQCRIALERAKRIRNDTDFLLSNYEASERDIKAIQARIVNLNKYMTNHVSEKDKVEELRTSIGAYYQSLNKRKDALTRISRIVGETEKVIRNAERLKERQPAEERVKRELGNLQEALENCGQLKPYSLAIVKDLEKRIMQCRKDLERMLGSVIPEGSVFHMTFNKNTIFKKGGNKRIVKDLSGNENHGEIFGAKTVDGIQGEALEFDGIKDYVSVPFSKKIEIGSDLSVIVWAFADDWNHQEEGARIISKMERGGWGIIINSNLNRGKVGFTIWINNSYLNAGEFTYKIRKGWNCFVGVYDDDGNIMSFYVNGKHADSTKIGFNSRISYSYKNTMMIGADPDSGGNVDGRFPLFNGKIDEAAVYDRALTADEIKTYYESAKPFD